LSAKIFLKIKNIDSRRVTVTFTPKEAWQHIDEDPAMAEDLRLSRTSEVARRRADHERHERLLGPVLTAEHRRKMWQLLHPDETGGQ
jgi:hypothetical protein